MRFFAGIFFVCDEIVQAALVTLAAAVLFVAAMSFVFALKIDR